MSSAPPHRALCKENAKAPTAPERAIWRVLGTSGRKLSQQTHAPRADQFPRWWSVFARSIGIGGSVVMSVALFMYLHHPGALGEAQVREIGPFAR